MRKAFVIGALLVVLTLSLGGTVASKGTDTGATYEQLKLFTEVLSIVQTQYVDVPLLVRYTLGEGENYNMRPAVFAGPSVGFEVGCKTQALASSGFYDEVDCGETNPRKKTVFDFVAGAELGIQSFVIGLRYTYGFTDLLTAAEAPTLKNRMWALSLGYTF